MAETDDTEEDTKKDEKEDKEKIAPQDDVLKDHRKWYDLGRILKPNDVSTSDDETDKKDESETESKTESE